MKVELIAYGETSTTKLSQNVSLQPGADEMEFLARLEIGFEITEQRLFENVLLVSELHLGDGCWAGAYGIHPVVPDRANRPDLIAE